MSIHKAVSAWMFGIRQRLQQNMPVLNLISGIRPSLVLAGFLLILMCGLLVNTALEAKSAQKELATVRFEQRAQGMMRLMNDSINDAFDSVKRLRHYLRVFDQKTPVDTSTLFSLRQIMSESLRQSPAQYNHFFAFEPEKARRYFRKPAMLGVLRKDEDKLGTPAYNHPAHMKYETWTDKNYLTNERELWYHGNKRDREIHVSPAYFDRNYMKTWVISVTQGLFEGEDFRGVVGVDLLLDYFFDEVERQRIGDTGGMLLIDRQTGLLMTRLPRFLPSERANLLHQHGRMEFNLYKGAKQSGQWQDVLPVPTEGVEMEGADGRIYRVTSYPLQNVPWALVSFQAVEELGGTNNFVLLLSMSFAILLTVCLVLWWLYQRLLFGLSQITACLKTDFIKHSHETKPLLTELQPVYDYSRERLGWLFHEVREGNESRQLCSQRLRECQSRQTIQAEELSDSLQRLNQFDTQAQKLRNQLMIAKKKLQLRTEQATHFKAIAEKAQRVAQRSQSDAEEASQAKAQFLANMNHELRTPMNAIIGYTEILQEDVEELGHYDYLPDLQKIHGASYHLLDLINNLFDLSKVESSQMDLYLETFDIAPVLQDIANNVQPLVEKQENVLKLNLDSALGTMNADLTKIRQNLMNLLSNASKFSKQGIITLSAWREIGEDKDWILFEVNDQGIGMTDDQVKRLFQPFTQMDEEVNRRYGGSGVGLALTWRFCQIMGGDIQVKSALGEGSTFTLRLPADVLAAVESQELTVFDDE